MKLTYGHLRRNTMLYGVWVDDDEDDGWAWIDQTPNELEMRKWRLNEGESAKDWFPSELEFQLSDEYGIKLADAIPNVIRLLIVSERLKQLIESQVSAEDVEFFPIKLRNQKKRLVNQAYYLMNVLRSVPCFNKEESDFRMGAIIKDQVDRKSRGYGSLGVTKSRGHILYLVFFPFHLSHLQSLKNHPPTLGSCPPFDQ